MATNGLTRSLFAFRRHSTVRASTQSDAQSIDAAAAAAHSTPLHCTLHSISPASMSLRCYHSVFSTLDPFQRRKPEICFGVFSSVHLIPFLPPPPSFLPFFSLFQPPPSGPSNLANGFGGALLSPSAGRVTSAATRHVLHRVPKKLSRFVFVRTSSNFHQFR